MSEKIEQEDKSLFQIYNSKCVTCVHLFPSHPDAKPHNRCHFSSGNDLCPAQEIKIVVAIDKKDKLNNLKKSLLEDDIPATIEQLNKLVKLSSKERQGLLSALLNEEVKPKKKKSKKD